MASPTIHDVASRAGVNISTVSRVISASRSPVRISEATARRVRDAAMTLGYEPSSAARALRLRRTRNIGLLLSDALFTPGVTITPVPALAFAHIEAECAAKGYSLQLMRLETANPATALSRLGSRAGDGMIFMGVEDRSVIERCRQLGLPAVELMGSGQNSGLCEVDADLVGARCEALRYAASLGHRRMAFALLNHPRYSWLFEQVRTRAAHDPALVDCSISSMKVPTGLRDSPGEALADAWAAMLPHERPTVLLAHEHIAAPAMGALAARGWRCPRDVSLIALSRTHLSESTQPRLTGIVNQIEAVARAAVILLIDHVESERPLSPADAPEPVACQFVVRESCGPVPVL